LPGASSLELLVDSLWEYYHYVVVVFGLGLAGQALGRVMKPILTFLALNGIRNIMYVDDGRTAASKKAKADRDYGFAINTFVKAGFIISKDKSNKVGDLAQPKEYLGFEIDSVGMVVFVPALKMARI
jgi:hypothetical protein